MLKTLPRSPRVGPADHGRRMTLDRFDRAIGQEGYLYELNKGVIEVVNVPHPKHLGQVQALRNQFVLYQETHPGLINAVAGSNEAKILIAADQSERHPDLSIYLSPAPDVSDVWSVWVPEIVIEVVSQTSNKRDYEDEPPEYLKFGVNEYWIVDALKRQMTVLCRRGGQWQPHVIRPSQKYSTHLLPGFQLNLKRVLAAAK
jgi:Uma2 family endonuclease